MLIEHLNGRELIHGFVYGGIAIPIPDVATRVESLLGPIFLPGRWVKTTQAKSNDTLYDWATIHAQLLTGAPNGKQYKIGGMYMEFENNSGAAVSVPTFDRAGGKAYYDSLSSDSTRDYLRVPLVASKLDSTDLTLFPNGNKATFFAQATGTEGVNGKTFSAGEASRIYGVALVAFPDDDDPTQDIVHSRFYFDTADQLVKTTQGQPTATWPLVLG